MPVMQKKICLLGDFAVGKTSLVRRFVEGRFDDRYLSTIGVKVSRFSLERPAGDLNLIVWDLAGSDEYGAQASYLRGAAGALIVCDLIRRETLASMQEYAARMRQVNPDAALVFLGNKVDLVLDRAVEDAEMQSVCSAFNGPYLLCSAKTGERVSDGFLMLVEALGLVP